MLAFGLEGVKAVVTLLVVIKNTGLTWCQDFTNKWPFSAFAGGEEYFARDTSIDITADMCLRLLCASTIIRPGHGEDGINQGTID